MTSRRVLRAAVLSATALGLAAAGLLAPAAAAGTDPFGDHVRDCAQGTGFTGTHHPGTHLGVAQHLHGDHAC